MIIRFYWKDYKIIEWDYNFMKKIIKTPVRINNVNYMIPYSTNTTTS